VKQSRRVVDRRLANIRPVLTYSQACGASMPPGELLRRVSAWDWRVGLVKLATLAAVVANTPAGADGAVARSWTIDLLASGLTSRDAWERQVAQGVVGRPEPIAHQASIQFLQSVVLLHASESGRTPSDGEIALLLLVANDYFSGWFEDDGDASSLEAAVANVARSMLHDRTPDRIAQCLRLPQLLTLELPAKFDAFAADGVWSEVLNAALGSGLDEFLELLAVPTVMLATDWGRGEPPRPPLFLPEEWAKESTKTPELLQFVRSVSATREQLKARLRVNSDGLPLGPSAFWRTPFVELGNDRFVCLAPGVLGEQVRNAIWGRILDAANELDKGAGKTRWLSTFGYRFEYWARNAAILAGGDGRRLRRQLRLSKEPGTDEEVEDVTLVEKGKVALFSAKSRLMREDLLKGATSIRKTIDWLDKFLFGTKTGGYRDGALRLLDAKAQRIRNGDYVEQGVPANAEIFPVLLTFDDLGIDTPPGYKWMAARLHDEGLLVGARPTTALSAEGYEQFLGLSLHRNAFEILTYKTNEIWRECRFVDLFHQLAGRRSASELRLPGASQQFDELVQRSVERLFRQKA
jgi:hypothetical protein